MEPGTIKFYDVGKAFGFVTPDVGGHDIYLPGTVLEAANINGLSTGQRVTFEQAPDSRGPKVIALQLLGNQIVEAPVPRLSRITMLCDLGVDNLPEISAALQTAGYMTDIKDIVATPLSADELRHLTHLMAGRYKVLFAAAAYFLDDTDNELEIRACRQAIPAHRLEIGAERRAGGQLRLEARVQFPSLSLARLRRRDVSISLGTGLANVSAADRELCRVDVDLPMECAPCGGQF